jgi:hypothetical protein
MPAVAGSGNVNGNPPRTFGTLQRTTYGHRLLIEVIAMMKSLALSAAFALILAACASAPVSPDKNATANAKPPAGCVGQTATLIPLKDRTSCAGVGSTYTRQDIDNTGEIYLDRALQMLDPSITRH